MTAATNATRGANIPALERASNVTWPEWLELFAAANAASLSHGEIATVALARMPAALENPEWWAQMATIAFEQHVGIRRPGQSADGTYRVSASRTIVGDRDAAIEFWAKAALSTNFLGAERSEPRRSRTDKRTFWRSNLTGLGKLEVAAAVKDETKTIVTMSHEGLPAESDVESWRAFWKEQLARFPSAF
ncbi:hypothetical protein ICL81_05085 [Leucobacter sp. cx-328]|uniref:hypothetical protein n=1 Tax=unclassified Leucobacter TaxID=2621730 RepID=UPI00165D377E|nr:MULTISPECIES: hypothetical protein [unclassified Leucobacter]MBC9943890.1 hypothetical protein [Leucobacter sp. cx-328]